MKHNGYYPIAGSTDYGKMGPFDKKKKKRVVSKKRGPFGTMFVTKKPVVNDTEVVKSKKRG